MCGLNFLPFGTDSQIFTMNQLLSHRGQGLDSSHCERHGFFQFGHVRLAIQGLSHEFDQPYHYGGYLFLFVGEIFNFRELMPEAKSDVEVLAKYYCQYGAECFTMFDGFWSVVVYQYLNGHSYVHVFTDDLAKKPLYYHIPTGAVSSEIKALCILDEWDESLPNGGIVDQQYISSVSKWGYTTNARTFNKNIRKIPPCSHWTIDLSDGTPQTTYGVWGKLEPKETDIRAAIETSVKRRLISDRPVSLLVSGGLDSSIIYKLVEQQTHDFTVFHVDNEEAEFLNYLEIPGDIKVVPLKVEAYDLDSILYYNEGPVDLGSMLPQYELAGAISRERFSVALSGDGADELFGGYRRSAHYDSQYSDIFEELVHYHLPRLDKLMMAHTIELRSPFLSRAVVEGALALRYEDRIHKKYLKQLFSDIVPAEIINREKYPLKSENVKSGGDNWRYSLVEKFMNEVLPRYFIR